MTALADPPAPTPVREQITELTQTVSASRLMAWQQCRLKFWFRYVEELARPKPLALHLGQVIHATLEEWNRWRWQNLVTDMEKLQGFLHQNWQQGLGEIRIGDEEADVQRDLGWSLVDQYIRASTIPFDEKPEAVEVAVESDLSAHGLPILRGVIDLVRPGGRIVDFKTTSRSPKDNLAAQMYQTQTSTYAVLYRDSTGSRESSIELHHLIKAKSPTIRVVPVAPVEQKQIDRLFRVVESYLEGLLREDIIPSPGFQCASCEFFAECRRWG